MYINFQANMFIIILKHIYSKSSIEGLMNLQAQKVTLLMERNCVFLPWRTWILSPSIISYIRVASPGRFPPGWSPTLSPPPLTPSARKLQRSLMWLIDSVKFEVKLNATVFISHLVFFSIRHIKKCNDSHKLVMHFLLVSMTNLLHWIT